MKYLSLVLLTCCTVGLYAQNSITIPDQQTAYGTLKFNNHAYDLEDHWVVFPKNPKTGKYSFGFIYLDTQAGFTFNLEGSFGVDALGHAFRDSTDYLKNAMYKVRLGPNTSPVAAIPDNMLADLKVKSVPDWLALYKQGNPDKNSVAMKVLEGKHLNSAGAPQKALEYLEDAYKTEPHAAGLEFELTYSYNELGQFEKAITILNAAIANAPDNPMFYKELGFAYMQSKDMDSAIKTFNSGIVVAKQHRMTERDEMGLNLSFAYSQLQQYDKAINAVNEAIADAPGEVRLYIQLATIYLVANDADNAIKAYTKAIDVAPANQMEQKAQMAWSIALIYRDQKKDKELYAAWGQKAKDWVPANSKGAQFLKTVVF